MLPSLYLYIYIDSRRLTRPDPAGHKQGVLKPLVYLLDTGLLPGRIPADAVVDRVNFAGDGEAGSPHGTAVATTILAECPDAKLVVVRVLDDRGWLRSPDGVEAAFAWIAGQRPTGPAVVCTAFGDMFHHRSDAEFRGSPVARDIADLKARGIPTVAAAGNMYPRFRQAQPQGMAWPAILREVISVGALDEDGAPHFLSQRLHESHGSGCHTTLFATPAPPGDTSGAAARVAGRLAALWADVERLLAPARPVRDGETGLAWPGL